VALGHMPKSHFVYSLTVTSIDVTVFFDVRLRFNSVNFNKINPRGRQNNF
jgi:hypothetical protein